MEIKDLMPYFTVVAVVGEYGRTTVKCGPAVTDSICYTFGVEIPPTKRNGSYIFTPSLIEKINSQLSFMQFDQCENGEIPLGFLVMLTN